MTKQERKDRIEFLENYLWNWQMCDSLNASALYPNVDNYRYELRELKAQEAQEKC